MKLTKLIFIFCLSVILSNCKKKDLTVTEYFSATIDGIEFNGEFKTSYASIDENGNNWLQVYAANSSPQLPNTNPNYQEISFSLINECLKPGTYDKEFIQSELDSNIFNPFSFAIYLNDSSTIGYILIGGEVIVNQIDYMKNGNIMGEFAFQFFSENLTDTIQIDNGKFHLVIQ